MDKVSIIVPIYNVEEYLTRCLDSLICQTYPEIEILMVDDCSTDGSAQIAQKYAENHPNQCVFISREKNGGLSAARNSGVAVATGDWIMFVDSDDWITPDCVQILCEAALRDKSDVVMSNFLYAYPSGATVEVSTFGTLTKESSHQEKIAFADPCSTTRLYRRTLFSESKILFPEDIWRSEDVATIIPLLTRTEKITLVDHATYYYFQRSTSLSNTNFKNVDVSFYPKTVERMIQLSVPGFETELEYRAIHDLMYGMIMIMIRSGRTKTEIAKQVDSFHKMFPTWRKNPYLHQLPLGKRIFIRSAEKKSFWLLKSLIFSWDLKQKLFSRQKA